MDDDVFDIQTSVDDRVFHRMANVVSLGDGQRVVGFPEGVEDGQLGVDFAQPLRIGVIVQRDNRGACLLNQCPFLFRPTIFLERQY